MSEHEGIAFAGRETSFATINAGAAVVVYAEAPMLCATEVRS